MKKLLELIMTTIGIVSFIAIVAICVVPSDDKCISGVMGGNVLGLGTGAGRIMYKVENRIVYKEVVNRFTGDCVAVGCFGLVFKNGAQ